MKITLNSVDERKLEDLFVQSELNIDVSNMLNEYLLNGYNSISAEDINLLRENEGYLENDAFKSLFYSFLSVDSNDPYIKELEEQNNFGYFSILDPCVILDNPYFKNIHVKDVCYGSLSLINNYFEPYEGFNYFDVTSLKEKDYAEIIKVGYFKEKVNYLALLENNKVWMSITPHEIYTMEKYINKAKGNVITFGLGLGYYAFMVSEKSDVNKVTIVEKDKKVIDLFKEKILPFFPHKEKIEIIKGNAFSYLDKAKEFDTLFVDIYQTSEDALPLYLKFKKLEAKLNSPYEIDYWIEDSILTLLRRYITAIFNECSQGYNESDYIDSDENENHNFFILYQALKHKEYTKIEDIQKELSNESIKELVKNLN